jgi:hypothetical protein
MASFQNDPRCIRISSPKTVGAPRASASCAVADSIEWQPKAAVERHNRDILVRTAGLCDTTDETRR